MWDWHCIFNGSIAWRGEVGDKTPEITVHLSLFAESTLTNKPAPSSSSSPKTRLSSPVTSLHQPQGQQKQCPTPARPGQGPAGRVLCLWWDTLRCCGWVKLRLGIREPLRHPQGPPPALLQGTGVCHLCRHFQRAPTAPCLVCRGCARAPRTLKPLGRASLPLLPQRHPWTAPK